MEMMEKSSRLFLEELASKAAVPGGGGAAALVGAVGTALGNMVGNLTAGKKKYAAVEPDILALNERAEALRRQLEGLVETDAAAFAPLAKAYGIPKDDPARAEVMEKALEEAAAVPLEIMACCCTAIGLLEEYEAKGSVLAISDAGCGALFCKAALEAAGLNVAVNTRLMADRAKAARLDARAAVLLEDCRPRADGIYTRVCKRLGGTEMAELLKGGPAAAAMNEKTAARAAALTARGICPTLAVVRVGERPDDLSYEKGVLACCAKVGVAVRQFLLGADAAQEELLAVLDQINRDGTIHGCLLFRPLPPQMDDKTVRATLAPEKDVDGITDASLAGVFTGSGVGYAPCTAQACVEILDHYGIKLSGRRVTVVGRSLVVGKPAAMLLDRKNATVTLCNSRTRDLPALCRNAEVLVVAMGKQGAVGEGCFAPGQVVVDVGIHVGADGKLCGDVDFAAAGPVVGAITPVPGGVGAMTTSVLAAHVVDAAEKAAV